MDDLTIRASLWSLVKLGLIDGPQISYPMNIVYLLQYSDKGCLARCKFCAQSIVNSSPKKFLSRITWPTTRLSKIINALKKHRGEVRRICFQTIIKPWFLDEALNIIRELNNNVPEIPISLAITPIPRKFLEEFREYGVDYLGVGLDASSPRIFRIVNKPYSWSIYMKFIDEAIEIYGYRRVMVHLIVGLGEKPLELYKLMEELIMRGANIALFAYTPIDKGVWKPEINILRYREAQIIRYFLLKGYRLNEILDENNRVNNDVLEEIIKHIEKYLGIFITSGCPYCNRPYYNESPRGPFYNFYSRNHVMKYLDSIINELEKLRNR
ncbi:radical SAM protein [Staphylothermus hellenicus]|uniref:Radical SAM domain protein n=1 Tax=Staphylothermus hellenicus (strain DSM 12710 / JCM 10830 / BK20S6-10-b1 / P8) TaxID=591019 RepID=D7DC62_STAHD|nr:radical SAM protein [Staphylothermus hellenicus]ADI31759.1 Radical SAM domain protein [Staphylothermus hellenicus DSM 12710]